jgi:DNA primase
MKRFTPAQLRRARERYTLSTLIARDVKLTKHGSEWTGLCPFHKERTPSFTIVDAKGFYHCFGCGAHGDAIAWRMARNDETFPEAVEALLGEAAEDDTASRPMPPAAEAKERPPEKDLSRIIRDIRKAARPIIGTPGEGYFRQRGITIPLPDTLRYLARCLRGERCEGCQTGRAACTCEYLPAVICDVQELVDSPHYPACLFEGRVVALHRLFLDPATLNTRPRKVTQGEEKMLLGSPLNGSIRLAPAAPSLGSCEGVETGLSIMQRDGVGVWSAIYAGRMPIQAFPPVVEAVYRYADRDKVSWKPGALYGKRPGEHFATLACAADRAAGRRTMMIVPKFEKADQNNLLKECD